MSSPITIIGGGLAGAEAAWQAARRGCNIELYEMKPTGYSPAHHTPDLGELVCSNSLRAEDPHNAVGLLKEEMRRLDSLIMAAADATRVPAGRALAVDRALFARHVTQALEQEPLINIVRREVTEIPPPGEAPIIIAAGPLAGAQLSSSLAQLIGSEHLAFYDAIAPIVYADSLNHEIVFSASRYEEGPGDYLNCPMNREQYQRFIQALTSATQVPLHDFEEPRYFEGCLPIEIMAARGEDTPRFGPMKPVGLIDPRTGREAYAVVQLRKENQEGILYNLVGFQTKLTHAAQKEVFRLIPGLEQVRFARLGSIHRNTFVCAPKVLQASLQLKVRADILLAGQISGVEGYVESAAGGLLAGINAAALLQGRPISVPPPATAMGSMIRHLTTTEAEVFQPSNINFGLFPPLPGKKIPKKLRGETRAQIARQALADWLQS
ncbi:methylenetetrahydrofolate--tRNA-(uracil(54)-C(5))-methyltransferase (FADH(2)-oxidizing) TrmFO [Desulfurivibrio dismutans]|uniref:methylenetetrahydrofolate--tRNA-(uracil(54)- C(5))-methyltransferase (FADH(2)-oxidizing) TrmFO n=1 Tax=Desulfurivibrio dismutans TaxID=1398908 RepID=UPI0023DA6C33|nr:methylenetetrahydrofolate--tRNA-(uracil(54)-C(5))-methyltransferase (FADH(2)-oxidizing) TrmFO [Desulfurivibrio alkaliphilus]MDF1614604.1 methylenetetrahydrofolate--tRNA-(uracil(54)-C(5))-methyltransferase (FADH(2)-oxidizing) TrmFO [Desulfurivibrio alkaliphilus]